MCIAFIIISTVMCLNTFSWFGQAIKSNSCGYNYSVFQLMFGVKGQIGSNGWMILMFIFQLITIIGAVIVIYRSARNYEYDEDTTKWIMGITCVPACAALVMSFCTNILVTRSDYGMSPSLSYGPILFSVIHILAILAVVVTILYYQIETVGHFTSVNSQIINSQNQKKNLALMKLES